MKYKLDDTIDIGMRKLILDVVCLRAVRSFNAPGSSLPPASSTALCVGHRPRGRPRTDGRGPSGRGETAATLGSVCFPRNEADVAKAHAPAPPTEPVVAAEEEEEEAQESNNNNKGRKDHGRRTGTNSS